MFFNYLGSSFPQLPWLIGAVLYLGLVTNWYVIVIWYVKYYKHVFSSMWNIFYALVCFAVVEWKIINSLKHIMGSDLDTNKERCDSLILFHEISYRAIVTFLYTFNV
jgi:hypothetical protein